MKKILKKKEKEENENTILEEIINVQKSKFSLRSV